jgi:hypothetical protein
MEQIGAGAIERKDNELARVVEGQRVESSEQVGEQLPIAHVTINARHQLMESLGDSLKCVKSTEANIETALALLKNERLNGFDLEFYITVSEKLANLFQALGIAEMTSEAIVPSLLKQLETKQELLKQQKTS